MRAVLLAAAVLAGCGMFEGFTTGSEHRVESQDEAGTVHFAVLAVAPWADYRDALQPHFQLTADQAVDKVVPTSALTSQQLVDAMRVAFEAGNTGVGSLGGSPPAPGGKKGKPTQPRSPLTDQLTAGASLERDPMTEYWVATALYQEVQLLNRYVRDAVKRQGYTGYVVRFQISLLPRARNVPYDAYTTLSFFTAEKGEGQSIVSPRGVEKGLKKVATTDANRPKAAPVVIPLLVTDNLEGGLASRSTETARQLAASVSFASSSFGGGASADKLQAQLESALGTDLNSLLTVGRVNDNTIRVRLGAMQQGSTRYAMVPRTHSVTILLMMPQGSKQAQVVSRTTMVDVKDGIALRERSDEEVDERLRAVRERYELPAASLEFMHGLLDLAQRNETEVFFERVALEAGKADHKAVRLSTSFWMDLVSVLAGGQYAAVAIELPEKSSGVQFFEEDQTALVIDDGVTCTTTLRYGKALKHEGLRVFLRLAPDGAEPALLAANDIRLIDDSRVARFTFASLAQWNLDDVAAAGGALQVVVRHGLDEREFAARYRRTDKK